MSTQGSGSLSVAGVILSLVALDQVIFLKYFLDTKLQLVLAEIRYSKLA